MGTRGRILLAEDSRTQAERFRLLLEGAGYEVEVARNGVAALDCVRAAPPDLIVSDVVMPEMDGYTLCQEVKAADATRRIPFVLLTGERTPADIIRGLERGADNFITKPYEDEYLLTRIERIFANLELRRQSQLDIEVTVRLRDREIVFSADKQQIIELLFSTSDELLQVNAHLTEEIAERRRAEDEVGRAKEEAERANKAKSEFLSRMSHELRTPLNSILGFAQLLELEPLSEEQQDGVGQILRAGRHLLDLINEVLDVSRIEAGRLQMSIEPVPVSETLRQAIDLVRPMAATRQIAVHADPVAPDVHVLADRQRLQQVLLNLLSNAVKYNRAGGTVAIACERAAAGRRLQIHVSDTGGGIPADRMSRLFTPFERLGAESTEVEGTGLGLTLSRHLAEAMGGTIHVRSHVGTGTTFSVELPEVEGPSAGDEPAAAAPPESAPPEIGKRLTVLYVEDNLSNLRLVERVLARRPGVTLLSAIQGSAGLDLARAHGPDLVLLDRHLPDISGDEVLRVLGLDPRTRDIPVVILSADASPGQIQRLLDAGAHGYLTKPLDVPALLALVDDTVPRAREHAHDGTPEGSAS